MSRSRHLLLIGVALVLSQLPACAPAGTGRNDEGIALARSDYSIYDLGSVWRDQSGATRPLTTLGGRPQVVAMIYTRCASTCPVTIVDMKRIESNTPSNVGFVLVTLDPDADTPRALAQYASAHGLAAGRWTLLTGSDADTRELAATLGVGYRRLSSAELAHSNVLTLLDSAGQIVLQQAGLGESEKLVSSARALVHSAKESE